jgi:hypothetical protein
VLRRYIFTTEQAAASAGLALHAQTPTLTPQPATPDQPQSVAAAPASTTLTGCVYKEKDIPGRAPNVAERAGVMEDYIFVEAKASTAAPADPAAPSAPEAVGTSGTAAKMFKLEKISDDKLTEVVGKRVEVTGSVDKEAGDTAGATGAAADRSVGPDRIELPEFEVSSIRAVEGTCPAIPSTK